MTRPGDYTYTVKEVADNAIPGVALRPLQKTVRHVSQWIVTTSLKAEQVEAADTVAF